MFFDNIKHNLIIILCILLMINGCNDENRKLIIENNYKEKQVSSEKLTYPNQLPYVEESRASHPAWMYRDLEHPIWEQLIVDPQNIKHIEKPFHDNIQTRILEKDYYKPKLSVAACDSKKDPLSIDYYLSK